MVVDPEQHGGAEEPARGPQPDAEPAPSPRPVVPFVSKPAGESARAKSVARTRASSRVTWERWANWVVGISAGVFLLIALGGYLYHRGQLAEIAAEHLRLMITGPARLSVGVPQRYTARTTTVTGHPLPAQMEFVLYGPDGQQLMAHKEKADERGIVQVIVEAEPRWPSRVRMEVVAGYSIRTERLEAQLTVEPTGYLTAISLQQPSCRAGEILRYRSLTLSRFSLSADRDLPIRFEIRAPDGSLVANSVREGHTVKGAGWGEFSLPKGLPAGVYSLRAISLDNSFPQVTRTFAVLLGDRASDLKLDVEFLRDRYAPGERAVADVACRRPDGSPAAKVRLKTAAVVFDKIIHEVAGETTVDGLFRMEFVLPNRMEQPVGQVRVAAEDGNQSDTLVRPIPIQSGGIRVRFQPEGGDLVAGMENRVYFAASDGVGRPVQISGRIVDRQGRAVAAVESTHEGMGSFQFEPQAAQQYRLKIDRPADSQTEIDLPPVSANHSVVLTTGLGVLAPDAPLEFNVRATAADLPLLAVVSCRGIEAGQQTLVTSPGANTVTVPLHEDAAGALRLALYDYRSDPPKLLAERLIYRRAARRLEVKAAVEGLSFRPGQSVEVPVHITDEQGRPAQADLGVAAFVVPPEGGTTSDRAVSFDAPAAFVSSPAVDFMLLSDLDIPDAWNVGDVPRLQPYLSVDAGAPAALDLLLGVYGRRRLQPSEGAPGDGPTALGSAAAARGLGCPPPMMCDNLHQLLERYQASLASYRVNRTRVLNALTTLSFFGGIGLVMFVAMLSLLNIPCGPRLWGPSLGVAAACIVIGAVLMDPERLKRNPGGDVPFAPTATQPSSTPRPSPAVAVDAAVRQSLRPFSPVAAAIQKEAGQTTTDGAGFVNLAWRPLVTANAQGRASVRLELPDRPGICWVVLDAHAQGGRIGDFSTRISLTMPPGMQTPAPAAVSVGDRINIPDRSAAIHAAGYPAEWSSSGRVDGREELVVRLPAEVLPGSFEAQLHLFPSLAAQAETAMNALAGQPAVTLDHVVALAGSSSLALHQWASNGPADPASIRRAKQLLETADAMRLKFEVPSGGYDRFGQETTSAGRDADPGSGTLTAMALWQRQMTRDGTAADPASARETKWLLDRRDGSGGFTRGAGPQPALDATVGPDKAVADAYILWALSESGQRDLETELNRAVESANKSDDPYRLALVAKAAVNYGRKADARPLLDKLVKLQSADGRLAGTASIVGSSGVSLGLETTALAVLAWHGSPEYASQAGRAVEWILKHRDAAGAFGTPHATLLALAALAADAAGDRPAQREGKCVIQRAGEAGRDGGRGSKEAGRVGDPTYVVVAQRAVPAGRRATVTIDGWQDKLLVGENRLGVDLSGADPMPYLLAVRYRTAKPLGDSVCPVRLEAKLPQAKVKTGEVVPLEIKLVNTTDRRLPMTVARIGLPAGLAVRPEKLNALRQSGSLDAFQVRAGELVCCWRSLETKATIIVQVDLAAVLSGKFTAPASRVYLNDTPEQKSWTEPLAIEIAE